MPNDLMESYGELNRILRGLPAGQKLTKGQLDLFLATLEPMAEADPSNFRLIINWVKDKVTDEDKIALAQAHLEAEGKNYRTGKMEDTLQMMLQSANSYFQEAPENLKVPMMRTLVAAFIKNGHFDEAENIPFRCVARVNRAQRVEIAKAGMETLAEMFGAKTAEEFMLWCYARERHHQETLVKLQQTLGVIEIVERPRNTDKLVNALKAFSQSFAKKDSVGSPAAV